VPSVEPRRADLNPAAPNQHRLHITAVTKLPRPVSREMLDAVDDVATLLSLCGYRVIEAEPVRADDPAPADAAQSSRPRKSLGYRAIVQSLSRRRTRDRPTIRDLLDRFDVLIIPVPDLTAPLWTLDWPVVFPVTVGHTHKGQPLVLHLVARRGLLAALSALVEHIERDHNDGRAETQLPGKAA
jgi:hypothetical protein